MARPKKAEREWSNAYIASLQPRGARYEERDPLNPGLRVAVQPSGAKSFVVRYSHQGQYRKLTLGAWPQIKLVESVEEKRDRLARNPKSQAPDARSLYRTALALKATGVDPAAQKIEQRKAALANDNTEANHYRVRAQWKRFLDKPTKTGVAKRPSSRKRFESLFAPMLAKWGERDVRSIGRAECEDAISDAKKRGDHAAAGTYMVLSAFFGWLEKRDTITKSPMRAVEKVAAESNRERTLSDDEIKLVWHASAKVPVFGDLVQLLLLTGQRRTECAAMKRTDIDVTEKTWTIAGSGTKNRAPHIVPLSDAALAIIERQPRFEGCDYVFTTDGETHFKGYSKGKLALDKLAPTSPDWTLHDLRRTLATRLAKAGVSLVVAEKILNHGRGVLNGVAGTYNRHNYLSERRAALDNWAATVDRIASGKTSNVVALRR